MLPRQRQQGLLRAEERQKLPVKEDDGHPSQSGQNDRPNDSRRKVFVEFLFVAGCLAPHGTEKDTAADAGQQAQTVNDVPDRGDYGQRRRLVRRPLILPHHGGVYYAVDGRDQDAAKGGEVFEVDRSDLIRQEIAREDCLAGSICRVQKGLDKYRRLSLLPYPAHHFQRMICPPSKQSVL